MKVKKNKTLIQNTQNKKIKKIDYEEEIKLSDFNDEKLNNLNSLKNRISKTISDISNLNSIHNRLPRSDYLELLKNDFASFYGYSLELTDFFLKLFSPEECFQFFESNEMKRPITIRSNPLKIKRRKLAQILINRGINLDPLADWSKLGLKIIESQIPIGATPEYLSGYYILQTASSFLPVLALAPLENERIADFCAAPGGKTTHIASLMRNTGSLLANDMSKERTKALVANLQRMGVDNCTVTNYDGKHIFEHFGKFDRILLDAPCTGLGVISKDESIKSKRTLSEIQDLSRQQKELIIKAIDAVDEKSKTGRVLVYSTCSVSVEENEEVINYALSKRKVKLVPTGIDFGVKGFTKFGKKRFRKNLNLTRRFYPHVHNMDGFFVAKLEKYGEIVNKDKNKKTLRNKEDMKDDLLAEIETAN